MRWGKGEKLSPSKTQNPEAIEEKTDRPVYLKIKNFSYLRFPRLSKRTVADWDKIFIIYLKILCPEHMKSS